MKVRIFSDKLSYGSLPTYEFPEPVLWHYVDEEGSIRALLARRCHIPLVELSAPNRNSALRAILVRAAALFESKVLEGESGGTVIVAVKEELAIVNPKSVTGFTVVVNCGVAHVAGTPSQESSPSLFWIPRELEVDDDFWRRILDEEAVEEVLAS